MDEIIRSVTDFIVKFLKNNKNSVLLFLILVVGVAFGLTAIILAIYLYKFCSNEKNDTITKSVKHRSDLPPSLMQASGATNPLYQHFLPETQKQKDEQKSVLLDLASDTKKIAQVFPLMTKTKKNNSNIEEATISIGKIWTKDQNLMEKEKIELDVPKSPKSKISSVTLTVESDERNPAYYNRSGSFNAQNSSSCFLSVQLPTQRTHSADHLLLEPRRIPGTGRKLPSTEHLEKKELASPRFDVPKIVAPGSDDVSRKLSYLPQSETMKNQHIPVPRKQNSSPLPQQTQRIYARSHPYSRSWNAENDEGKEERQGTNISQQTKQSFHQKIQRAPPRPPSPLWLTAPRQAFQQARSFEVLPQQHYLSLDQRSQSEQTKKALVRQLTAQIPQTITMVSKQCQNLWQKRQNLEGKTVFHQVSTDLSDDFPDVASTSFESNTESLLQIEPRKTNHFLRSPIKPTNAEIKRQRYKNLLQHRNAKTTTVVPAESSFESGGSDSTTKFGSSLDSAELGINSRYFDEHWSSTKRQKPLNQTVFPKHVPVRSLRRPLIQAYASYELKRDYSVDSKSDSLFRKFSRVDPWFESQNNNKIQYPATFDPNRRQRIPQLMHIMAQYRSADNSFYR